MIKTSVEKLAGSIGFDIAHSDDEVQANLINGLFEELSLCMDDNQLNTQVCYISNKLSKKTANVILLLSDYCKEKDS